MYNTAIGLGRYLFDTFEFTDEDEDKNGNIDHWDYFIPYISGYNDGENDNLEKFLVPDRIPITPGKNGYLSNTIKININDFIIPLIKPKEWIYENLNKETRYYNEESLKWGDFILYGRKFSNSSTKDNNFNTADFRFDLYCDILDNDNKII